MTERARTHAAALWLTVLAPLAFMPGGFSRFVYPKLLLVALAVTVLAWRPAQPRRALPRTFWLLLVVAALVFVGASLAGDTPVASLLGRWPRYEGLPVLAVYVAVVWLGTQLLERPEGLVVPMATAQLVLALDSVLDLTGHGLAGVSDVTRSGSLLGNATDQGLVAAMGLVVLAAARERSLVQLVGVAAAVVTLGCSGSRTALVLAIAGVVAVLVGRSARIALVVTGAVCLVVLALPSARGRLGVISTVSGRLDLWRMTTRMVGDHWLLGTGPSTFADRVGRYETLAWARSHGSATVVDSPHDWVLQALVAGGGVMLLAVLAGLAWFLVVAVRRCRADPSWWAPLVAVLTCVGAMTVNPTSAGPLVVALFLAGGLVGVERSGPSRGAFALLPLASAAVLTAGCVASVVSDLALRHALDAAAGGRLTAAVHDLATARRWHPYDADVSQLGAQGLAVLADRGVREAAAPAAEAARASLTHAPGSCPSLVVLGLALRVEGRYAEARTALDQAVADCPARPQAYVQRAVLGLRTGNLSWAVDDLRRAVELDPEDPTARRLLDSISGR